ncbi:L-methionine gamma-lyase-like [Anneissia japonica]|uniref:L-methionine gamma-lyase-like n=1 Tax=Anneissia japonica TaxID=1529436 RepID=UPI001425A53C|nr:L-methionine gamma-lyase-like [Anneissia japonica]
MADDKVPQKMSFLNDSLYSYKRTVENTHKYDAHTKLETIAVTSQCKLQGKDLVSPVVPSISLASTFKINKVDEYEKCLKEGYIYSRVANHSCESAAQTINMLEGGAGGLLFPSGMSAISTTLLTVLKQGDHVILPNPTYSGTYRFAKDMLVKYGIEVSFVEACNIEAYREAIKPNTKMLYGETPTNPKLDILDLDAFVAVANTVPGGGALTMVDGTFASPYLQQTLKHGVDISVHSCTKYIGGHSDILGGSVCFSDIRLLNYAVDLQRQMGNVQSPFDAFLTQRGIRTLPVRMAKHSKNAMTVAQYLEQHPKISRVFYPGLASHPQHEVAKKQMSDFSGMVVFEMAGGLPAGKKLVENLMLIVLAVSLGGHESLIEHPATMTHGAGIMSAEERREGGITDGLIRFSVGLEDAGDLIKDLEQALEKIDE